MLGSNWEPQFPNHILDHKEKQRTCSRVWQWHWAQPLPIPAVHIPQWQEAHCVIYLEKRISTLQSGWAQRSKRAESTPEVDTGEQGARSQQDGCLQYTRRSLKDLPGLLCHSKDTNRIHIICPSPPQTSLSPKFYHDEKLRNPFIT